MKDGHMDTRKTTTSKGSQTLKKYFLKFSEDKKYLHNVSKKTIIGYKHAYNFFDGYLWHLKTSELDKIKPAIRQAQEDIGKRRRENTNPKARIPSIGSVNTYITVINAFLKWAYDEDHFDRFIKLVKQKTVKKERKTLTKAQVKSLIEFTPKNTTETRLKMMCLLCLGAGLRKDEARKLNKSNIDLNNSMLKVLGKGNKERYVPLSKEMTKHLYKYTNNNVEMIKDGYLFATEGKKIYSARNAARDLAILCGKLNEGQFGFHQMRHTFGTNYIIKGGEVVRLQQIMGHSSINTTMIYVHMSKEHLKEGIDGYSVVSNLIIVE